MTTADLSLAAFRHRRTQRLNEALALYGGDPIRQRLIQHLWNAATLLGADRAAALWVDEYGVGLVHTHCVLDLVSHPPRDDFRIDPLRLSWDEGVPGLIDIPSSTRTQLPFLRGVQSACYVALGSDGARAWFLTVDSRQARERLSGRTLDELMFEAGEVSGIVLHMELAGRRPLRLAAGAEGMGDGPGIQRSAFSVLKDLEGRDSEPGLGERVSTRLQVAQTLHTIIGEDFVVPEHTLADKVGAMRKAFLVVDAEDSERQAWERVANALEVMDKVELARAVRDVGNAVERQGHHHGAHEFFHTVYIIAATAWAYEEAIDAAWLMGLSARRLADWDTALQWYEIGRKLAEETNDLGHLARAVTGLGNVYRDKGNLPAARDHHERALSVALQSEDADAIGTVSHDLMVLEKLTGRPEIAIRHGWAAVQAFPGARKRLRAMADLAWAFVEVGELTAAEDAYQLVVSGSEEFLYKTYALDALAYISALRGDEKEFRLRLEAVDAMQWQRGATFMVAELTYYRGKALRLLGATSEAEIWLRDAMTTAEENGHSQIYFDAEKELRALAEQPVPSAEDIPLRASPPSESLADIREELSQMRAAAAV